MTEWEIQNDFYHWAFKRYQIIVPNIYLYPWESDVITVTKANFVNEFEIKLSTADYKKDFEKIERHTILESKSESRPNYFWFICMPDVTNEVPEYAGLIHYLPDQPNWHRRFTEIKRPPRLHSDKITLDQMRHITESFRWKYWKLRLK